MKFLSPKVALYLYKSTLHRCMEYCFRIWAGSSTWYIELLDMLQKRICKTVQPLFVTFLEPLAHRRNVVSLSLSIGITFRRKYHMYFIKKVPKAYKFIKEETLAQVFS